MCARIWPDILCSVLSFLVLAIVSTVRPHGSVTCESRIVGLVPENLKVMKPGAAAGEFCEYWPDMFVEGKLGMPDVFNFKGRCLGQTDG